MGSEPYRIGGREGMRATAGLPAPLIDLNTEDIASG